MKKDVRYKNKKTTILYHVFAFFEAVSNWFYGKTHY